MSLPNPDPSPLVRAPFDDAPCGLVQTDGRGMFLRVNRLFCEWVGYAPDDLIGRRRLQDMFTMGGRIFHQTHWMPLLEMQGSISEVKVELVCARPPDIPVVMNAVRRERNGAWIHEIALFVARDRDRYEKELVKAQQRLELLVEAEKKLAEEALDRAAYAEQLVGIVSHDLRNPCRPSSSALKSSHSLNRPSNSNARWTASPGRPTEPFALLQICSISRKLGWGRVWWHNAS